jgi:DNA-binding transcriptional ArsR family regulator
MLIMFRNSVWAVIFLMLAVAASPGTAFAIPAGASMMPMQMPLHSGSGTTNGQTTGCNCGMPMQGAAAMARTESPARTAGGAEPSPCSGSAIPVYSGMAGTPGRVSGIRRIYPKNVLDHPERAAVYTTIIARPGIDLAGIASELGLNRETLRYHLDQLESNTRIVVMRDHGIIRYYENHGRYTPAERRVLRHLWNPTAKEILALVASRPGIAQAEISAHLAVTAATVRWYMRRFRADGLVTEQHEGKYTRYTVVPDVSRYVIPAPVDRAAAATA